MKLKVIFIFITFFSSAVSFAQGTAGDKAAYQYRSLIDMPTAGILKKGYLSFYNELLPGGSLITKLEAGVLENLSIAISYGGANIIGAGDPEFYNLPGVDVRFRVFNESIAIPAVAIGFNSQGKGNYNDSLDRFSIKSPGFFGAVSKNFRFLGFLSLHGTVNYSLETKDGDNFTNVSAGFEKTIGPFVSLVAEYNFALNDDAEKSFGNGNGYLSAGLRWSIGEGFTIGFDLRDLLKNKKLNSSRADRALRIEYIQNIF